MSALVERLIAARDELKSLMGYASADDYTTLGMAREVIARAANDLAGLEHLETRVIPGLNEQLTEQFAIGTKFAAVALKAERERDELLAVLREMFVDGPVHVALAGNPIVCDALEARVRAAIAKAEARS